MGNSRDVVRFYALAGWASKVFAEVSDRVRGEHLAT